jgi:AraC-like DNA-binding protein
VEGDARQVSEQRTGRAARRAAILHDLAQHIGDPGLNGTAVARRLGITPRYLRMLLEETGKSFSEHLLDKRLDRATAMLRDPGQRDRKIAEIAFACGFGDLSYFNRAFRRRYAATPSETRDETRPDDV